MKIEAWIKTLSYQDLTVFQCGRVDINLSHEEQTIELKNLPFTTKDLILTVIKPALNENEVNAEINFQIGKMQGLRINEYAGPSPVYTISPSILFLLSEND